MEVIIQLAVKMLENLARNKHGLGYVLKFMSLKLESELICHKLQRAYPVLLILLINIPEATVMRKNSLHIFNNLYPYNSL